MANSRNLVSTIGALASPKMGDGSDLIASLIINEIKLIEVLA